MASRMRVGDVGERLVPGDAFELALAALADALQRMRHAVRRVVAVAPARALLAAHRVHVGNAGLDRRRRCRPAPRAGCFRPWCRRATGSRRGSSRPSGCPTSPCPRSISSGTSPPTSPRAWPPPVPPWLGPIPAAEASGGRAGRRYDCRHARRLRGQCVVFYLLLIRAWGDLPVRSVPATGYPAGHERSATTARSGAFRHGP